MKYSLEVEQVVEDQLLSTPTSKKIQASIRRAIYREESETEEELGENGEELGENEEEDEQLESASQLGIFANKFEFI
jgi:hypothetical protein